MKNKKIIRCGFQIFLVISRVTVAFSQTLAQDTVSIKADIIDRSPFSLGYQDRRLYKSVASTVKGDSSVLLEELKGSQSVGDGNRLGMNKMASPSSKILSSGLEKRFAKSTATHPPARSISPAFSKEGSEKVPSEPQSLTRLLMTLVKQYMENCDLIIVTNDRFQESGLLKDLIQLPNFVQVANLQNRQALEQIIWRSPRCQGVLFFTSEADSLLEFCDQDMKSWAYNARVVGVGLSRTEMELLVNTRKGRKTEHILGIVKTNQRDRYVLYTNQLYRGRGLITFVTSWLGRNFTGTQINVFPDKISNLYRSTINVVTFEFPPSIIYRRDADGNVVLRYGWDVSVVEALAYVFNFTILYKEPGPGELWGQKLSNGSWNGMVGLLASGEGDMGIANLYITALLGRREFQEFSTPFAGDKSCCLARMEPPLPKWQSLSLPFQLETWMAILIGLFITGPVLCLLANGGAKSGYERQGLRSFVFSNLSVFGVHFRHPLAGLPFRSGTQVFVVFLWLYAIIITTGYSSNLTAFLTVSRQPASIETFKELFDSGRKVFGLGPFFKNSMAHSGNEYLRALADRFIPLATFDEIKPKVLEGKGVMIQSRGFLEYASVQLTTPQGRPKVRIMKECFAPFSVGLAFQSNSPLKTKFDRVITWTFESGLVGKWFTNAVRLSQKFRREDRTSEEADNEEGVVDTIAAEGVIPLSIDHMQGIFIILIIGYLTSGLSFLLEIVIG